MIKTNWDTLEKHRGNNLPHWNCLEAIYHVCFRLNDSIPMAKRNQWFGERQAILDNISYLNREATEHEQQRLQFLFSEKIEKALDSGYGDCFLARKDIGNLVSDSLEYFNDKRYHLHIFCIMPNHVHVLVEPSDENELGEIVHSWKSFTANQANKLLGRKGTFWQHEPYDHIIRSGEEYRYQLHYIWNNPGKLKSGFIRKNFT